MWRDPLKSLAMGFEFTFCDLFIFFSSPRAQLYRSFTLRPHLDFLRNVDKNFFVFLPLILIGNFFKCCAPNVVWIGRMEFRLKVVKSSNRTDIGIVLIFSDDEGANVFLGFCFLVVVITIDMCCAYVRRRIFNEMQQPSKCNETRSSFFSLFFYFFLFFFPVSFFDWVSDWKRIEIYTATSTTSAPGVWRGVWMMMVSAEAGAREKFVTTPTEKFPFQ